jgi:RNA polymerase sigma-70 factor (ECF subfamily)
MRRSTIAADLPWPAQPLAAPPVGVETQSRQSDSGRAVAGDHGAWQASEQRSETGVTAAPQRGSGQPELDPALLDAFRRGDDEGVRAVYARFSGPVYTVAQAILRDHDLATEAVQETFVRAWRSAAKYDPCRELAPWLYVIARRVSIDLYRSRRRHSAGPPEYDAIVALPPELDTIWEAYQVRAAVDRLPAEERIVVRLGHFEQLSHAEIAARLGVPIGTVKSRSHRAHRRLAEWLEPLCRVGEEPDPYRESTDPGVRHEL